MSADDTFDICVVGAGLVGLSAATALAEMFEGISIAVVDKEARVAAHQSSHNSGVVHSGLYYTPGSLKAALCVDGRRAMYELCERAGVPYRQSGKIVVATRQSQLPALEELERRGRANGLIGLERLGRDGIRDHEPAATGVAALFVPEAGVADFAAVAQVLADRLVAGGASILTAHPVTAIEHTIEGVLVSAGIRRLRTRALVNCGGLHADRIAAMAGVVTPIRIVPFRGEYYRLVASAADRINSLIYPVPDPRFPFLGVHFTRRVDGVVEVGPNAVLALGREHYRGVAPDWRDLRDTIGAPGFRRLVRRHWRAGTGELIRSRSRRLYSRSAAALVPGTTHDQLITGGVGVRAQAVGPDGALLDDFVIERAERTLHVLNAPSPGATACLAIGRYVAEEARTLFGG